MVQCKCYFWHQTEPCSLENLESHKGFWLRWNSILFSMSSELRFVKWVMIFKWNCVVKWVIFSVSFCWSSDFLLENVELKNSNDVHWNVWMNIKKLYNHNNTFKKQNSKCEILNHLYCGSSFIFGGTALRCFSLHFFLIFCRRWTIVGDIFTQPPSPPAPPPPHHSSLILKA